jgi:hypothetical protein
VRHAVRQAGDDGGRLKQTGDAQWLRWSFGLARLAAACSQQGDLAEGRGGTGWPGS